ncbi:methionyl-tRNA formyltransferase [Ornithinimicrobium sp. LYQ103]|uniref:methionyl-tRNA formyltransferase n=1 Tax=Ornithinimicrobium sp. LYQ103 TaxID=3378796 RepID=UPI003853BD12
MRYALIGGVQSTAVALDSLLTHGANVVGVLGYVPKEVQHVSGYLDVVEHARGAGVARAVPFTKVNDPSTIDVLKSWDVDVLLVVGLSQIVSRPVRDTARQLAVGFHPTQLPRGRGRAPIAWLVLKQEEGAATLFELADGADEGDILTQVPFAVGPRDHASDVLERCMRALSEAVRQFVWDSQQGSLQRTPQSQENATYWGARKPADGRIDWNIPAEVVDALVRASAEPHPGAYTVTPSGEKIIFMRSHGPVNAYSGVPGRLLAVGEDDWLVACGDWAIRLGGIIREQRAVVGPRVGDLVGYRLSDLDQLLR